MSKMPLSQAFIFQMVQRFSKLRFKNPYSYKISKNQPNASFES